MGDKISISVFDIRESWLKAGIFNFFKICVRRIESKLGRKCP